MPLDTYDDLKSEIASYLARSDVTSASAAIDTFIDLAEAKFNKSLRVLRMQEDLTISTVGGQSTVNLPSDFLELYSLSYVDNNKDIDYVPSSLFKKIYAATTTGRPVGVTIGWSGTVPLLRFVGTPDAAYDLQGVYYGRIPPLTSENETNWLYTDYPELYLNACLYYAFKRYRSPLAADYLSLTEKDIKTLNDEDENIQTAGGGLRLRVTGTIC